jgi:hypothetical protein
MFARRLIPWLALFAFGLTPAAPAAPVPDKDSPLAVIPAKSPLVLQLRGLERTNQRLLATVKNALPELEPVVKAGIMQMMESLPDGRKLQGLEPAGPHFTVFTELPKPGEDKPPMALVVAVKKYEDFRDGILSADERKELKKHDGYESTKVNGEEVFFAQRGRFAIVGPRKEVVLLFTEKGKGLDTTIDADTAKKFLDADLSAYVDVTAITKQYGDQIKAAKEQIEGLLALGGADKNTAEVVKKVLDFLYQGLQDGQAIVLGVAFEPQGIRLSLLGEVGDDTKTNGLLIKAKPRSLDSIDKLPTGHMSYTAMQMGGDFLKALGKLSFGLGALGGVDEKTLAALEKAYDALAAAGPQIQASTSDVPPRGINVMTAENPAKAAQAQVQVLRAMKGLPMVKGDPDIKENAEKYQGFELTSVKIVWDIEKMIEMQAAAPGLDKEKFAAYMKNLMGEGQNTWIGTDGKVVISVMAKDWADAKKLIDEYTKSGKTLGDTAEYKDVRQHLPAEATMLSLIDLPRYAETLVTAMKPLLEGVIPGLPENFGKPAVKGKTAYLGFALALQPRRGSVDVFLSGAAVHEIYKMYFAGLGNP